MRTVPLLAVVIACTAFAGVAGAAPVVVPDDYPTIQAALDANCDNILVKAGTYNETVSITHGVFIGPWSSTYYDAVPIVLRVTGSVPYGGGGVTVQGLHILRTASVSASPGCSFLNCRADSGLTCYSGGGFASVKGCTVFGSLTAAGGNAGIHLNTVVGGTLRVTSNAGTCTASGNYVIGSPATGISVGDDCYATDNYVRNCVTGITSAGYYTGVSGNVVEDCSGNGIVSGMPGGHTTNAYCTDNIVRRCGGIGIQAFGVPPTIDGNTVDSTGSTGMDLQVTTDHIDNNMVTRANGAGIVAIALPGHMRGNTVLHCAGDGIRVGLCSVMERNVAGHNAGAGIKLTSDNESRVRSNTSFYNLGQGFSINSSNATTDSVVNNIGFGNQVGLEELGAGNVALGCNDWFGNASGATSGVSPGATDFALDPLFCNAPADVVTLASTSPALNRVGCGRVGALAQGCATPTAADIFGAATRTTSLRAYPQPNHGVMRFAWQPLAEPATLELFDAQGARRYACGVGAGIRELSWGRADTAGRALPAGVYFARLRVGVRELGTCRVVLLD